LLLRIFRACSPENLKFGFTIEIASNSHYETNLGVCSAYGAANTQIGFLKGSLRLPFKKPIFIMRIAAKLLR
jgi:hypothetical protein